MSITLSVIYAMHIVSMLIRENKHEINGYFECPDVVTLVYCLQNSKVYAKAPEFSPALGLIIFGKKSVATNLR